MRNLAVGLHIPCHENAFDDGFPYPLWEFIPVRRYQGETTLLVTQARIIFHCGDEEELWPRVELISFKDKRHILGRVELVRFPVVSKGESPICIASLGFMMTGQYREEKGDWRSPASVQLVIIGL